MKHDYTALDSAIKEALATGPKTFRNIESYPKVKAATAAIEKAHNESFSIVEKKTSWRFIDDSLQKLCISREIIHVDQATGWALKGHENMRAVKYCQPACAEEDHEYWTETDKAIKGAYTCKKCGLEMPF